MKLIIVRHGETEENIKKIMQGCLDSKLNCLGKKQARKVAKRLKWVKIDTAYISDLCRAKQTAEEILKFHPNTRLFFTKHLRERSFGVFEGKLIQEYVDYRKKNQEHFFTFRPDGGESHADVIKRITHFYRRLWSKHPLETILIVAHGGPIRALYDCILGKKYQTYEEYSQFHPENCAVTILEISGNKSPKIQAFNCLKHL